MKKTLKTIIISILVVFSLCLFVGCKVETTPSVNFGFKAVDTADNYNESLSSFLVGKRFYTSIKIQINTDTKKAHDYKVVITVPKTKEVEVKGMGGPSPDSNEWDEENQTTKLTFTIKGYKEATPENILFYGTPTGEGEAEMTVHIYDEDDKEINTGYTRKVFFVYELQTGDD